MRFSINRCKVRRVTGFEISCSSDILDRYRGDSARFNTKAIVAVYVAK